MKSKFFLSSYQVVLITLFLAALGQTQWIQADKPVTALTGFIFYFLAVFILGWFSFKNNSPHSIKDSHFTVRKETFLFILILLIAAFFRFYRINEFPAGLFNDQGCEGLNVLRILREGWRPSFSDIFQSNKVCTPTTYAFMLLWFKLFPATQISFFMSSAVISLATIFFIYYAFRRLSGATTALLAIFFLAVMRWDVTYSRDAHPAIESPFFIGLTLALWFYALQSKKNWAFAGTGLALGISLYSYQVCKAFAVLMAVYAVYEWWTDVKARKRLGVQIALLFFVCLAVALPLLCEMWSRSGLGSRENELMAFPGLYLQKGIQGVWDQFLGTAFTFNRLGDIWYFHNIPGHRLLDDGMGVFFVLGFGFALWRIRERKCFYAVLGFLMMCLPAFLSTQANHASRLLGTIPFIIFLCGDFLFGVVKAGSSVPKSWRIIWKFFIGALLALCLIQNFDSYFHDQAHQEDCWRVGDGAQTSWIGKAIAWDGDRYSYVICSHFYGDYVVRFLGFDHSEAMFPLRLPESMNFPSLPRDKGVCLALEEGQGGVLKLFQSLYPGGTIESLQSPSGETVATLYRLTAQQAWAMSGSKRESLTHLGLRGTYEIRSLDGKEMSISRIDPVLNFTFRNDFPLVHFPPLSVHWEGTLEVSQMGRFNFLELTTDQGTLAVDGKIILDGANKISKAAFLAIGPHQIKVTFEKVSGIDAAFSLLWKKNDDQKFEVIPAFCLVPAR